MFSTLTSTYTDQYYMSCSKLSTQPWEGGYTLILQMAKLVVQSRQYAHPVPNGQSPAGSFT